MRLPAASASASSSRSRSRVGVVDLEGGVVPVACRTSPRTSAAGAACDTEDRRTFHSTPSSIAARERLRRADVRRVEAGVATEEPGLGVEPGSLCVVLDLDLGAELAHEPVERGPLGGAHVGRRDDAEGDAALPQRRGAGPRTGAGRAT